MITKIYPMDIINSPDINLLLNFKSIIHNKSILLKVNERKKIWLI